jgi:DNA polymerase III delta subunit
MGLKSNLKIKIQEVYFDLTDCLESNKLSGKIKGLEEFETLREFIEEQKDKVSQIEDYVDEIFKSKKKRK